jgi:hypothetical protein
MKACREWCTDPHFLDLGTSWRWMVSFTPLTLYPRENSPRYPLNRRLGACLFYFPNHPPKNVQLEESKLHALHRWRYHIEALFLFMFTSVQNSVLFWTLLVSGEFLCSMSVLQVKTFLLQDVSVANVFTYLEPRAPLKSYIIEELS